VVAVRDGAVAAMDAGARERLAAGQVARAIARPHGAAVDGALTGGDSNLRDGTTALRAARALRGNHRVRIAVDVLYGNDG
jgi:hypothetical protein